VNFAVGGTFSFFSAFAEGVDGDVGYFEGHLYLFYFVCGSANVVVVVQGVDDDQFGGEVLSVGRGTIMPLGSL
jgi:hypothetical protein